MKEKLNKCVTWADSQEVFKETPYDIVLEFISALVNVKKYIDLTMRDEFLLTQAISYIEHHQ